jgi:hypothetical protein
MSSNPLLWINKSKYESLGGLSCHLVEEKTNINKKKEQNYMQNCNDKWVGDHTN